MKLDKNKRRRQQQPQSGRPVLLTFYVARPARDAGAAATASAHGSVRSHHLHGGGSQACRGSKPAKVVDGRPHNRRAELLEYSRQLRALARQTAATSAATRPTPSRCRDTKTLQLDVTTTQAGAAPDAGNQPAAENRVTLLAGQRHERAKSQRQIKQRCFGGGGGGWSWKRVLVLVFPFHSVVGRSKSKRKRKRHDHDDRESNRNTNQNGWPATLLVGNGKLTVSRANRDHNGLGKKLMSIFRQRS